MCERRENTRRDKAKIAEAKAKEAAARAVEAAVKAEIAKRAKKMQHGLVRIYAEHAISYEAFKREAARRYEEEKHEAIQAENARLAAGNAATRKIP